MPVQTSRIFKILFCFIVGCYALLVSFNNITDYGANFQFVQHVMNMSDIFNPARNDWRGTNNPALHNIFYIIIIIWELSTALITLWGAWRLLQARKQSSATFNAAKKYAAIGISLGVLLWFFAFATIAGEWFLMWQSKIWNAKQEAFSLTIIFMLFLMYLNTEDK